MALEEQLDPGYEVPVIKRAPDVPEILGPGYSLAEAERLRQKMPVAPPEATAYKPRPTERMVDAITRAQMGRSNVTPEEARSRAALLAGGPGSPLPLGLGVMDFSLLAGSPKWAAEAGYTTGQAAATGEGYGGAAFETALAALPIAPTLGKMARGVPDAIDRALAGGAGGTRQSQRGVFLAEKWWTPEEKARRPVAEELETKGASPEDVLIKTGLVRDLDGSWAVELSDDKMKFKALEAVKAAREPIVRRISNIEAALQARDILDAGGTVGNVARDFRARTGTEISPEALTLAQQRTPEQLEAALENANNSLMAPIKGLKMKDVIEHPELFARIPEMAEMQVDFVTQADLGGKRVAGHFDPTGPGMGAIRSRAQYLRPSEDYGRSLFAHEMQHSIDYASGKDYGISPETIKEASAYWKQQELPIRAGYNAENTALYARELMEKNPGMTAEEALDKTLTDAWHYGESKDYAKPGKTINPENGAPYTEEGNLRGYTLKLIEQVPSHELQRRAEEASQALRETQLKRHIAEPTEAGREEQYMRNVGEARARLTQTRLDLTPEERREMFPMREQFMGLDRPPEALKTISELTGGLYGPKQVAAPAASVAPMTLREALADQPTTLRTLENLPGKRTMIPMQEIRDQLRRPEVTKAERDVLERVLARTEGDSISAENLVREVGLETKDFQLTPKEYFGEEKYANYGLGRIDRVTGPSGEVVQGPRPDGTWGDLPERAVQGRTTVHRSPTPTSSNNHFNDPNYFGHTRAFEADGIPHVVEIQSDLVQKAGKELSAEERRVLERQLQNLEALKKTVAEARAAIRDAREYDANKAIEKIKSLTPEHYTELQEMTTRGYTAYSPANWEQALKTIIHDDIPLHIDELKTSLAEASEATAQRPMFKNWERRLIREELSRAVRLKQEDARMLPFYEKEFKENVRYADELKRAQSRVNAPPVVRFADADTVARVEGWPDKLAEYQKELRIAKRDFQQSKEGIAAGVDYSRDVELYANRIAELEELISKTSDKNRFYPEHQGIYDRYKDEVTKYLRSLGAKHIKDDKGHGWWEVPVKPEQRRTPIFSMGGAAVAGAGAASYNADQQED